MSVSLRWVALFYGAMAALGLLAAWIAGEDLLRALSFGTRGPAVVVALGLAGGLVLLVAGETILEPFSWPHRLREEVADLLGPLTVPRAVAVALLSGIGEELFFRVGLQPILGLWPTSLLFGLLHTAPGIRGWAFFAFLGGVFFGLLYESTGSLWTPALAHAFVNGVQLVLLARDRRPDAARGKRQALGR